MNTGNSQRDRRAEILEEFRRAAALKPMRYSAAEELAITRDLCRVALTDVDEAMASVQAGDVKTASAALLRILELFDETAERGPRGVRPRHPLRVSSGAETERHVAGLGGRKS